MQAFGKAAQHQPYDQPMRGCDRPHIGPAKGIVCDDRGGDEGAFGRRGVVIGVDGADRRPYLSTVRMAG